MTAEQYRCERLISEPTQVLAHVDVWTERDFDILMTLTRRVRILSMSQIRTIWWPGCSTNRRARKRIRVLSDAGLVERTIINAHPTLGMTRPLASWHAGQQVPDARRISNRAQSRWKLSARPTEVVVATRKAANIFGSTSRGLPKRLHWNHDLLLSDVYAQYRHARPDEAALWLGEDAMSQAGFQIKDPDAFLMNDGGIPVRVIESAGSYSTKQVRSFHEHCAKFQLGYELW
jgi:hypothetical protein